MSSPYPTIYKNTVDMSTGLMGYQKKLEVSGMREGWRA
jgi:hypothetical protein